MDSGLALIAVLSLSMLALVFGAAGILKYGFSKITKENSKKTTAILIGFREYNNSNIRNRYYDYYDDYDENGKGRLPLLKMNIDGETVAIETAMSYYDLTSADIGKVLNVRYRRSIGLIVVVDDEISIQRYNKLQNIFFWIFESIAIILVILTIIAGLTLPKIL